MKQALTDVLAFHETMGFPVGAGFAAESLRLRRRLIDEEHAEVLAAFDELDEVGNDPERQRDLVHELIDLMYVVLGTFVELGVDPSPAWEAVHAANMQKTAPVGNGKALKPITWRPPAVPIEPLRT